MLNKIERLHNVAFFKIEMRILTDLEVDLHGDQIIDNLSAKSALLIAAKKIYASTGDYFGFKKLTNYDFVDEGDLGTFATLTFIDYMNQTVADHQLSDVEIQKNVQQTIFNYVTGYNNNTINSPLTNKAIKRIRQFALNMLIKNYGDLVKQALQDNDLPAVTKLQTGPFGVRLRKLLAWSKTNRDFDFLGLENVPVVHATDDTQLTFHIYEKLAADALTQSLKQADPIDNQTEFLTITKNNLLDAIQTYQATTSNLTFKD